MKYAVLKTRQATQLVLGRTLMGFVVATKIALRPRVYFGLQALAHFLEREVRLDRQISQLRLVGMLSTQRFATRFV